MVGLWLAPESVVAMGAMSTLRDQFYAEDGYHYFQSAKSAKADIDLDPLLGAAAAQKFDRVRVQSARAACVRFRSVGGSVARAEEQHQFEGSSHGSAALPPIVCLLARSLTPPPLRTATWRPCACCVHPAGTEQGARVAPAGQPWPDQIYQALTNRHEEPAAARAAWSEQGCSPRRQLSCWFFSTTRTLLALAKAQRSCTRTSSERTG